MKNQKAPIFASLILLLFSLASCLDDSETVLDTASLFSSTGEAGRSYFISSAEIDLIEVNGTLILDECITDNTITYYPNGRYEENEGRTKCNISDPPGLIGTWKLINDDTQLSVNIGGVIKVWDIISISNNSHTITRSAGNGEVTFILNRFQ